MCSKEQGFYNGQIDSGIPAPKQRRKKGEVPTNVAKAITSYKEEYKKLYGVNVLAIEYKNGYIYIEGQAGISFKIFKSRLTNLRFRNRC